MQSPLPMPPHRGRHAARARTWRFEADVLADGADDDVLTDTQRAGLLRMADDAARQARRERFRAGRAEVGEAP